MFWNSEFGQQRFSVKLCSFEVCITYGSCDLVKGHNTFASQFYILAQDMASIDDFLKLLYFIETDETKLSAGFQMCKQV